MQIKLVHVILLLLISSFIQDSVGKRRKGRKGRKGRTAPERRLVAYWGQNSSGNQYPDNPEDDLVDVCQNREYDIVVIGFVVTFFDPNNKDQMPGVNFANHCWDPVSPDYPDLYRCPNIEEGINACQAAGKKVLISLGGATGNNDLDDDQAVVLAQNLWDLFLEGEGQQDIRPFGSAVLDGIDLDIEDHRSGGYAQLVKSLRQLEETEGTKKYLITGAPQCPYPDASLGPGAGTALGEQGAEFDYLFVQFYNNYCYPKTDQFNIDTWLEFSNDTPGNGPKICVGMPAAPGGSGDDKYYNTPEEVEGIYEDQENEEDFGGFMLWDAAWDQNNIIDGEMYSYYVHAILDGSNPTAIPTTPGEATTSPEPPPTSSEITTLVPTPTTASDFCEGKDDGDYADPNNPCGYITCSHGIAYPRDCPSGLVWDDDLKQCNYP